MRKKIQKAMEYTRRQCKNSWHYCFICLEKFDPKQANICRECDWLICPKCHGCYCKLDRIPKEIVDSFYETHCCNGEGCPYGKGGAPYRSLPMPDYIELKFSTRKFNEIKQEVTEIIDKGKDKTEFYFVDHGFEHAKGVAQNIETLEKIFEESSIAKTELGRFLTPEEMFRLKAAGFMHDLGRTMNGKGSHALKSAEFVKTHGKLPLNEEQRNSISDMCLLHSDGATRERYGTDNLSELVKKGLLSRESAYMGTLIRIGDALDAGKRRAEKNTTGETFNEVKERIKKENLKDARSRLAHWHGHMGFNTPKVKSSGGKMTLELTFESKVLQSHGADVAFRVKDMLRDIRTTLIDKKQSVNFKSDNMKGLQQWFSRHRPIFNEEIEGIQVNTGG